MLKGRGARTDPCGTPSLRRRNLLLFAISGGKGEAAITNHLHDHVDHVSIRQQSQQLAGEDAVPHSVVGCCEVDEHSSGLLLSWKAILDVLCQQGDLIYGRPALPTLCPSMAHSSCDGHVEYVVWPLIVGSRKNPGMPSQYLMCPEVAISQRIHLWEGKSFPITLAEVPTLHWIAVGRNLESWWRYKGGPMLWPRELS